MAPTKGDVLKKHFGYSSFRDGQEDLINSILDGRDCVGIMPMGAGKSVCFQVPAIMSEGITIVISPLISLMKDQVDGLRENGVEAAYINSALTMSQTDNVLAKAKRGEYKIIYIAPERLEVESFLNFATNASISMVSVDEAHCVSQWGHDFRLHYRKIPDFISRLKKRPVLSAFTATATTEVRKDIVELLNLKTPFELVAGFNRKNLYFEVQKPKDKYAVLLQYIKRDVSRSGIIYCSTRNVVENVCERLRDDGLLATRYHAGLDNEERRINQDDFLYDKQRIMVATNAFGMGIDKSNVSFVVHYNMPKNIESYYQEAGRAGRDGSFAECILLFSGRDISTNLFLIDRSTENSADTPKEILVAKKEKDRERLYIMKHYCHTNECLREYILRYFQDYKKVECNNCSNCKTTFETIDVTIAAQKILSCIARIKSTLGISTIVSVLKGLY